ncbi:MAG: hypothetical protein KGJ86_13200, partial [Chloroflexota bacterium]|nr:hypothetical protein [Chloroflexota bacterium]
MTGGSWAAAGAATKLLGRLRTRFRLALPATILLTAAALLLLPAKPSAGATAPPTFSAVSSPGLGDRLNSYPALSMQWFNGNLYVGTGRDEVCAQNADADFFFPQYHLYSANPAPDLSCPADKFDLDLRAEIWRYTPGTGAWARLFQSTNDVQIPTSLTGGEVKYVSRDISFRGAVAYTSPNGTQNLYFGGNTAREWLPGIPGPRILRSVDGSTFAPVNLTMPDLVQSKHGSLPPIGFRSMVVYNGRLFLTALIAGAGNGVVMEATPPPGDPSGATLVLKQVSPIDMDVFELQPFNGYLYAGAGDLNYGYSVWKTTASGAAPYIFSPVVTNGAGRGATIPSVVSMQPFKGWLYVGSAGWFPNLSPTAEMIRVAPDDSWQVVVGNSRLTTQGFRTPISGQPDGFGNVLTFNFWRMMEFQGALYMGTQDDAWAFRNTPVAPFLQNQFGFDVWSTTDGVFWTQITKDGFGHPFDYGARTMEQSAAGLALGSVNDVSGGLVFLGVANPAAAPARLEVELQGAAPVLSWDAPAGATQFTIFRAPFVPNSEVGIGRLSNLPQFSSGDSNLWRLGHIAGDYELLPNALDEAAFSQLATTSRNYFVDGSAAAGTHYAYYVVAQGGGAPSNKVIAPSLAPVMTFDLLQATLNGLSSQGKISSSGLSTLQTLLTSASSAAQAGNLAGAISSLQQMDALAAQNP